MSAGAPEPPPPAKGPGRAARAFRKSLGVLLLGVGVFLVFGAGWDWTRAKASAGWPEVQAILVQVRDRQEDGVRTLELAARVKGETAPRRVHHSFGRLITPREIDRVLGEYEVDQVVQLHRDPRDPGTLVLLVGPPSAGVAVLGAVGLLGVCLGIWLIASGGRARS